MDIDWNSLFITWYSWLGSLNSWLVEPVRSLSDGLGVPLVSAFLFGLLGTTAPCQLSTNMGAMAFLARRPSKRAATVRATVAYIGAKVLVYTLIGVLVLTMGRQLLNAAGPYLDWPRKLVGPLMILLGLAVAGVIRVRLRVGERIGRHLEERAAVPRRARRYVPATARPDGPAQMEAALALPSRVLTPGASASVSLAGTDPYPTSSLPSTMAPGENASLSESAAPGAWSSFLLGVGFSLAFCPTLFVLFFGATLMIVARSAEGFTFPAFFVLGTVVPLVLFVGLALTGSRAAERLRRGMRRANKPLRWVATALLILLGLHDTLVYWFL